MPNDLFRLVSLRQSKTSSPNGDATPPPDPRVRFRTILEQQGPIAASPRESKIKQLKQRYSELWKKADDLEQIQRALLSTYVAAREDEPVANAAAKSRRSTSRGAGSRAGAGINGSKVVDADRFTKRVENRLTPSQTALFRPGIASVPSGIAPDINDLVAVFDPRGSTDELNQICTEIHAIEENVGDDLPTVSVQSDAVGPVVAAVGWGELIVAKESLVGYDAREIAHIENVLPGEGKVREHQRLSKTEELQEAETVSEKESEKDSQTTDRFELQAESQEAIHRDFALSSGVNTSGRYGVTQVDASLDAAFSQNQAQSRSASITTAREIVTKAVERTFERVRKLRRLAITEEIREFNRHELINQGEGSTAISGMYLWVEKIQKVELRHYGTRMMVEFHVPEPALSLHERAAVRNVSRKLPPFEVSAAGIHGGNYMCLAQRFGALDVEPPPTLFVEVGWGWTSTTNEDAEGWAEDQFSSTINVPAGYRPVSVNVVWSGLRGKEENREFNFAFAVAGKSQGEHTDVLGNRVLGLDGSADWPQGVPVSGRVHGAWDGAMYVQVTLRCIRTSEALDSWRLRTWQALRAGYEALERRLAQDQQQEDYQRSVLASVPSEAPTAENRRIEREELQKWAIKSMRLAPQNFNAIEQVGELQEISPGHAEAQAPLVRFYEDAFEWEHMSYVFYPYHWARRAAWPMRTGARALDSQHQAFLQAGAARVIVPVTPGFEARVAWFLDEANAAVSEIERILAPMPTSPPSGSNDAFRDLWIELLLDRKPDNARGSGTLNVAHGMVQVTINPDSNWRVAEHRDLGRELYIAGERYEVAVIVDGETFQLDRPYAGEDDAAAVYVAGSTAYGPPWTVRVPTSLVVLADNVPALKSI